MLTIFHDQIPGAEAFSTHNGSGKTSVFGGFSFMRPSSEMPIGKKYNRLTILEELPPHCRIDKLGKIKKMRMVKCVCDCGNIVIARWSALINGTTKSCSCLRNENAKISQKKTFTTHGLTKHPLHRRWDNIKTRCYNEKSKSYKDYGGRGITICSEWLNDFMAFYNWALSNGWKRGLTIERKNNDGNYEPSNCIWIAKSEQSRNRRSNRWLEYDGKRMLLCDWALYLNVRYSNIWNMLKNKSATETLSYYSNKNKQ